MTAFRVLFVDAWRRARDRKAVAFLVILGLIVAAACSSVKFGDLVPAESLRSQLTACSVAPRADVGRDTNPFTQFFGAALKRTPRVVVRAPAAEDDLPFGLTNAVVAELELSDLDEFDRRVARWRDVHGAGAAKAAASDATSARDRADFLEAMLRGHGWETVIARPRGDEPGRFLVAAATDHPAELEGKWKLGLLFGNISIPVSETSRAQMVVILEQGIFGMFSGIIGMLILLGAFAGALPDLLQKGSLDLVLARPIGRTRVLLFTYAGAVLTVLLVTAAIFLACSLTFAVRSGHFSIAFAGCSLMATAIFAAVYPVAMVAGYLTGSGNLATVAGMGCWGLAHGLGVWRLTFDDSNALWKSLIEAAVRILPKVTDLYLLGDRWLAWTELSPQALERFKDRFPPVADAGATLGASVLFAAVVLLVTALLFRRRDC